MSAVAAVAWPTTTAEVVALVEWARRERVPLVPYGAGSGVCGAAQPHVTSLVVDTKRLRNIDVDAEHARVTVGAGVLGQLLEDHLNERGFSLGHFPSSIMCSTVGGWLATASAGQFSTRYGSIENMIESLTFVDGRGRAHELTRFDQPSLLPFIIGSEGTLGIITQARLRIVEQPRSFHFAAYHFARTAQGCEAIRRLMQREIRPTVLRLYDPLDSFFHQLGGSGDKKHGPSKLERVFANSVLRGLNALSVDGERGSATLKRAATQLLFERPAELNRLASLLLGKQGNLLIAGFAVNADESIADAERDAADEEFLAAGGAPLGPALGERWLAHRYNISFGMSKLFDANSFVDTMEVAAPYSQLLQVYDAVVAALSPLVFVMAHFSHAYRDGCSIYFTFIGPRHSELQATQLYDAVWQSGLVAARAAGATTSHHHGIGQLKRSHAELEIGALHHLRTSLKATFDPENIMNPQPESFTP